MRRAGRRRRSHRFPGEDLELVEDFGEVIRKARNRLGLTQQDLARQLKERLTIIKKIEAGQFRPSIELARKLERFLKVRLLVPVEEETPKIGGKGGKTEFRGISLGDLLKDRGSG